MSKKNNRKEKQSIPKAVYTGARIAPRKARLVADLIRGCDYDEAVRICAFTPKKAAVFFKKLLESAYNNAEQLESYDTSRLYVEKAYVDMGNTMHRFRAMAMGRSGRIRKRTSHLTVVLAER